jgi:hypothetical protein
VQQHGARLLKDYLLQNPGFPVFQEEREVGIVQTLVQ